MMRRISRMEPLDKISDSIDIPELDPTTIPKVLYGHKASLEDLSGTDKFNESRVMVIYTGGTIGMMMNDRGKLAPIQRALETTIRLYPHMHDAVYAAKRFNGITNPPLVLPDCREKVRLLYWVYEYNPLLDSSDMTMDDWVRIAEDIKKMYHNFDGFVVLHGTDTLAYTASALSFMMENLGKPIIMTGSQIPLFETRSDGRDNFIGSMIMAGIYNIPEVAVFFNSKLYRGNRTVKVSSGSLAAFGSPNMAPLAVAGISIQVDYRQIFRQNDLSQLTVRETLNRNVGLLRIFPSISTDNIKSFVSAPMMGVVLQTYGSGNIPSNRLDLIEVLKEATERGVIIVNITQCSHGGVETLYETGQVLADAGVLPGYDMTPEAALTKLSYVIARTDIDHETKRKMMMKNLRGEMTSLPEEEAEQNSVSVIAAITKALQLSSSTEVQQVKEILVPTLLFAAINNSDLVRMEELLPHIDDINRENSSGETALQLAAAVGDWEVVQWLLQKGASVHKRNKSGHNALWLAVEKDNARVLALLRQTGAHLTESPIRLGEELVSAAANDNVVRLRNLELAGCDMNLTDHFKRTGLHAACMMKSMNSIQFLLSCDVNLDIKDFNGVIAELYAESEEDEGPSVIVDMITQHRRLREQFQVANRGVNERRLRLQQPEIIYNLV